MPIIPRHRFAGPVLLALLVSGCSERDAAPGVPFPNPAPRNVFTVMSYNLNRFGLADRDGDGQEDDFKPDPEIDVIIDLIARQAPDVLAVQEVGDRSALELLRDQLREAGQDYAHLDILEGPTRQRHLGLLSRHAFVSVTPVTNLTYSIRELTVPVQRGFQQVELAIEGATTPIRLLHVHLKSKTYHDAGQTEMRRSEARLLATLARRLQRENPGQPLILCGDFGDTELSAALRELVGGQDNGLHALALGDRNNDQWTCYMPQDVVYVRSDYIMVNDALLRRWQPAFSGIVRDPHAALASDHRPIIAAFSRAGSD